MNQNYKKLQSAALALAVISTMSAMGMEEGAGASAQGPPEQGDPSTSSILKELREIERTVRVVEPFSPSSRYDILKNLENQLSRIEKRPDLAPSIKEKIQHLRRWQGLEKGACAAAGQNEDTGLRTLISEALEAIGLFERFWGEEYEKRVGKNKDTPPLGTPFAEDGAGEQGSPSTIGELLLELGEIDTKYGELRRQPDFPNVKYYRYLQDEQESARQVRERLRLEELTEQAKLMKREADDLASKAEKPLTDSEKAAMRKKIDEIDEKTKGLTHRFRSEFSCNQTRKHPLRILLYGVSAQIGYAREELDQNIGTGE